MKREKRFEYESYDASNPLPEPDRRLVEAAECATLRGPCPLFALPCGSRGAPCQRPHRERRNIESEVFPSGLCAERTLLYHVQACHAGDAVEAVAIASDPSERECYPCGACRRRCSTSSAVRARPCVSSCRAAARPRWCRRRPTSCPSRSNSDSNVHSRRYPLRGQPPDGGKQALRRPGAADRDTDDALETEIKAMIKVRDHKAGNVFLGVVHRIDRPVSGAVLFAKTSRRSRA